MNAQPHGTADAPPPRRTIAVVGMGPVGQILSSHLQDAGHRVVVCDIDKVKMHLIRKEGIRLTGVITKQVTMPDVVTSVVDLAPYAPDVIAFCVKAYHLPGTAALLRQFRREGTFYLSAQNGIDTEVPLGETFGEANVLRMVVNFAGNTRAPNATAVTFFTPPNYVASIDDGRAAAAREWAAILNETGLTTHAVDSFEILRRVWEKAILNACVSPLCAVSQLTMKEVMAQPEMVDVVEKVIIESMAVAAAENITFEANFVRHCMRYLRRSGGHFPSLAVDLFNKRPTEIDFMNGKFVEYGRKHYIPTPLNLSFTTMVKAIGEKQQMARRVSPVVTVREPAAAPAADGRYFLGVDLGSAYTKVAVMNDQRDVLHTEVVRTMTRDPRPLFEALGEVHRRFTIDATCAAGYGREQFPEADVTKTEIHCAARSAWQQVRAACTVVDIGAEDIKIIQLAPSGQIDHFHMNSKCASGTGAFLVEVAEKVELPLEEMSTLAAMSSTENELNSFCTVFAKTEVLKWTFEHMPIEDIARGIYLSLANRIHKMRVAPELPVHLAGGVIAHHPYLRTLLEERFAMPVTVLPHPQFTVAHGAALFAQKHANAARVAANGQAALPVAGA